ncbi:hypothetical protein QFZ75_008023 [Streptomyces sp. V3I8]|uniref:hypothetical protein n=1 Tax=Streptomyces sp. V3I8 TaxID=3042279 RepID=UPI0027808E13|nr:hypothetical protein [Streptomyces sp. V3I8]MDQ1041521.1 hypothetical protein [Streptomyces sp. V3I8]
MPDPLAEFAAHDGFTLRALLLAAAGTATEEPDPADRAAAHDMLTRFQGNAVPRLTADDRAAYRRVVDLAADYERGNLDAADMPDEPTDDERLAAALARWPEALHHALDHLTA